jgi:ATP-dependent protease ClpP protease subunit
MVNGKNEDVEGAAMDMVDAMIASANSPKPAPELMHIQLMDVDLDKRELYVGGDIEEDFGSWFTATLRYLENRSHDPITVWLNTPGGSVLSMFTFHDLVRKSPCEIIIIATGQVCSAGVLMLACGNKRLVTESTILMSHRGEDAIIGSLEQMEAQMKVQKWFEEHWAELMARYTPETGPDGKPRDQRYWFQLGKKNAEWWITGGAAIIAEGLADGIYGEDK